MRMAEKAVSGCLHPGVSVPGLDWPQRSLHLYPTGVPFPLQVLPSHRAGNAHHLQALGLYPFVCVSFFKKLLNVIMWFGFLAPVLKSLRLPLRGFFCCELKPWDGGRSHMSCLPCSPGVQAAATREDLSYDSRVRWHPKNIQIVLLLPWNLPQACPCATLTAQGPMLHSYSQSRWFLRVKPRPKVLMKPY